MHLCQPARHFKQASQGLCQLVVQFKQAKPQNPCCCLCAPGQTGCLLMVPCLSGWCHAVWFSYRRFTRSIPALLRRMSSGMKSGSKCTAVSDRGMISQQQATRLQRYRPHLAWQFSSAHTVCVKVCCRSWLTVVLGVVSIQLEVSATPAMLLPIEYVVVRRDVFKPPYCRRLLRYGLLIDACGPCVRIFGTTG